MFIKKMLKLMEEKGIKRNKISKDLNFGINQIKYWETHGNIPSGETVRKIAVYLGTTPEYLLGDNEVPEHGFTDEVNTDSPVFSQDENKILIAYKYLLNSEGKKKAAEYIDDLAGNPKLSSDKKIFMLPTAAFDGKYSGEKTAYTAEEIRILLNYEKIEDEDF